jgi:hypothetical protein
VKRRSSLSPDPRRLEAVKNGNRLYGYIYQVPDGRKVYLAHRFREEWFRGGETCVSDAVRLKKAALAIDDATLLKLRARKIDFVGMREEETGDLYLTRLENYFDRDKAPYRNYTGRGGALQRFLPRHLFAYRRAAIKMPKR